MATYRGRKTDICRAVGYNIWGNAKCPSSKRPYGLGQHGPAQKDRRSRSEYGEQLLAKQVIRRYYNVLEKQFRRTFEQARRMTGNTSVNFLTLLELRLQTAVWRLGYASTIFHARQMVNHGHITVNGRVVDIPSYRLRIGDVVAVRDREVSRKMARDNNYHAANVPPYFDVDVQNMSAKVVAMPDQADFPRHFQVQQVVEFYAR